MSLDFVLPYLDVWLLPQRPYWQSLCCMDINLTGSAFVLPVSIFFVPFSIIFLNCEKIQFPWFSSILLQDYFNWCWS